MKFGGLQKLTLLDYPGKVACTVFTSGCNLRCPFCHNAALVGGGGENYTSEDILSFLKKRRNVLEGMCLTGGEPLIQNGAEDFLAQVKSLGYKVKLDTNGCFPERLRNIISAGLADYVAMDVKNSADAYPITVGCYVDIDAVSRSVELLKSGVVDYEFRTTVTGSFHSEQSIEQTAKWLSGAKVWYLQQFVNSGDLIDPSVTGADEATMRRYKQIAERYVSRVELRGIE